MPGWVGAGPAGPNQAFQAVLGCVCRSPRTAITCKAYSPWCSFSANLMPVEAGVPLLTAVAPEWGVPAGDGAGTGARLRDH